MRVGGTKNNAAKAAIEKILAGEGVEYYKKVIPPNSELCFDFGIYDEGGKPRLIEFGTKEGEEDNLKDDYCLKNGVSLLRVPYDYPVEQLTVQYLLSGNESKIWFEKTNPQAILPSRATWGSAGYDLHSVEDVCISSGETKILKTGVTFSCPPFLVGYLFLRSSLSIKTTLILGNGVGVVDSSYYPREIGVVLTNIGEEDVKIQAGDRVAQIVFSQFYVTDEDNATTPRNGGFGHTGK